MGEMADLKTLSFSLLYSGLWGNLVSLSDLGSEDPGSNPGSFKKFDWRNGSRGGFKILFLIECQFDADIEYFLFSFVYT